MAKALCELGADVNRATKDGWTPIMAAAQNGHLDVVRAMHALGADIKNTNARVSRNPSLMQTLTSILAIV